MSNAQESHLNPRGSLNAVREKTYIKKRKGKSTALKNLTSKGRAL